LQLSIKFHDNHNYAQLFQDASQVTSFHFYCVFVGDTVEKEKVIARVYTFVTFFLDAFIKRRQFEELIHE